MTSGQHHSPNQSIMSSVTQEHTAESIKTREGITFMHATRMFSTEAKAEDWFIQKRWGSRSNVICSKCGKPAVVAIKDRPTNRVAAKVVIVTDAPTLTGFVHEQTKPETMVFTEEARAYDHIKRPRRTVKHSIKEFVNAMVHTNGMESRWAMLNTWNN